MKVWTEEFIEQRARCIRHEAAHMLGAIHARGRVFDIEVRRPQTEGASLHSCVWPSWVEPMVTACGIAWAQEHEPMYRDYEVRSDIEQTQRQARDAGCTFNAVMRYASDLLADQPHNVRKLAARIEAAMPKAGVLKGRNLDRIYDEFELLVPQLSYEVIRSTRVPDYRKTVVPRVVRPVSKPEDVSTAIVVHEECWMTHELEAWLNISGLGANR